MAKRAVSYARVSYDDRKNESRNEDIWLRVYIEEKERALERWFHTPLPPEPNREDFANADEWIDALIEHKKERERQRERIFEMIPCMKADKAAARGTLLNWNRLRKLVWERDSGICQVCGRTLSWEQWECGHIVDRCVGGTDKPGNLVVMCIICNRLKPLHVTHEDYEAWRDGGYWWSDITGREPER